MPEGCFFAAAITDHGPGMDEKTAGHVFEQFYQGDTSHKTQGNGLGLAMVKKIVQLHGEFFIESVEIRPLQADISTMDVYIIAWQNHALYVTLKETKTSHVGRKHYVDHLSREAENIFPAHAQDDLSAQDRESQLCQSSVLRRENRG